MNTETINKKINIKFEQLETLESKLRNFDNHDNYGGSNSDYTKSILSQMELIEKEIEDLRELKYN